MEASSVSADTTGLNVPAQLASCSVSENEVLSEDLDGEAISSPAARCKRQKTQGKGKGSWYPEGPSDLAGVLSLNQTLLDDLLHVLPSFGQDSSASLRQLAKADIVLTSCYSGTGCFEATFQDIMQHLGKSVLGARPATCYAATELNPHARACLMAHRNGPLHVFGDVLGRLPSRVRKDAREVEAQFLADFKCLQDELHLKQMTKTEFVGLKTKLESAYVKKLQDMLESVEFNDTDYCFVHETQCPISPRDDPTHRQSYWVEASGNTCCPWSGMATGNGWLDAATLPFLTWAYSTRFFEPDSVLQENVPRFPADVLSNIISSFEDGVLKHINTRPLLLGKGCPARKYCMRVQTFSPVQLGVPSQRLRQYTALHLSPWVTCDFRLTFEDMFYRTLKVGADIYLDAVPRAMRASELSRRAQELRGGAASPTNVSQLDTLSAGDLSRLESWQCWAEKQGLCGDLDHRGPNPPTRKFVLVDLTQNAQYMKRASTDVMPCLLTHTLLWDLAAGCLVPVMVHWLAQGFPHPAALGVPSRVTDNFPFDGGLLDPADERCIPLKAQRALTGNAMHWNCVGSWILYNVSCTNIDRILEGQQSAQSSSSRRVGGRGASRRA